MKHPVKFKFKKIIMIMSLFIMLGYDLYIVSSTYICIDYFRSLIMWIRKTEWVEWVRYDNGPLGTRPTNIAKSCRSDVALTERRSLNTVSHLMPYFNPYFLFIRHLSKSKYSLLQILGNTAAPPDHCQHHWF